MGTAYIILEPSEGIQPSDSPATFKRADDTNQDKAVIEYADAVTENFDWSKPIPAYASGGTLMLYWRGNSASVNAVRWSVSCISRANDESTDVAFNTADVANYANASANANRLNIDSLTLTNGITGWAADELVLIRISRIGGDGGDTFAAAAQLIKAVLSYTT